MKVSESTVKRWFSRGGLSLEQFSKILEITHVEFQDLGKLLDSYSETETHVYTHQQEAYFVANPLGHSFFNLLLRFESLSRVKKRLKLPDRSATRILRDLEKVELIGWMPNDRIKFLTSKKTAWRKDGPLRKQLLEKAKQEFLRSDFSGTASSFRFLNTPLTEKSVSALIMQISKIISEQSQLSELENAMKPDLETYGILMAVRPWDFLKLNDIKTP
jgi:hypothetical protein